MRAPQPTPRAGRDPRVFGALLLGGIAVVLLVLIAAGTLLFARRFAATSPDAWAMIAVFGWLGALVVITILGAAWTLLDSQILLPLTALARELHATAHLPGKSTLAVPDTAALGPLGNAARELAARFAATREEMERIASEATARVDEQKGRLGAVLADLTEGIIMCNLDHRVLLYNRAAVEMLNAPEKVGLGLSLFALVSREPILQTLERVMAARERDRCDDSRRGSAEFICTSADARVTLRGRMTLVLDAAGNTIGYVTSFTDISGEITDRIQREALRREATEGLRRPIANLRAAAETLAAHSDLDAGRAEAFRTIILHESIDLARRLDDLTEKYRNLGVSEWPMWDVHTADIIDAVARRLGDSTGLQVTMTGIPLWLRGESYSLILLIDYLLRCIHAEQNVSRFDAEALLGDRRVYIDLRWEGEPISNRILDRWLDTPIEGALGSATARAILYQHGSEIWSLAQEGGSALLRIPLAAPSHPQFQPSRPQLPPRPEFYDFDLFHHAEGAGRLADRRLRDLTYVVFDTETTGLRPSEGDEVVSIAGVRIVNRRILTGECFERLVDPRRSIPAASTHFHGITDDMVQGKPPIELVLQQFKAFVGDAVLVAHNAAFDMKFLALKEAASGVVFDNAVLDTLLLSVLLHDHVPDHTLDGMAQRFEVEISDRHTAKGDALVTAAIFLQLLRLLEAEGIMTLGEALAASQSVVSVRRSQAQF